MKRSVMANSGQYAIIGGITANAAMATLAILILAEFHIAFSSVGALCAGLCVLSAAVVWARKKKATVSAESATVEKAGTPQPKRRFLVWLGVFLIGLGETFFSGMLFVVLLTYCSAHHHFSWALPFIGYYSPFFLFLVCVIFAALNAARRQWLLVAGNILGTLLLFGLLALATSGISGGIA